MAHHRIRQGLDIPIAGEAAGDVVELPLPATVAYDPRELRGFIPRLAAREGDVVEKGQPVLHHKFNDKVCLVAPVAGTVKEVRRGARRVITAFVIERGEGGTRTHKAWDMASLQGIGRDHARDQLLAGGLWPLLRTRPLDHVADPENVPQSILIGGMESGPLQPGPDVLMSAADKDALQAGVHVLKALTDGSVHLTTADGSTHAAFQGITGVEGHTFSGPHPAGDPALQVNFVEPPKANKQVWWLRAWDAVAIGRLFLTGELDASRVYAAVGTGAKTPRFVRTIMGAPVADVVGEVHEGSHRFLRGSVLTGSDAGADGWVGLYSRAVHVLPDKVERRTLGWALPQPRLWSFHKAFLAAFGSASKRYDMQPALHGGHRAIVPIGAYERVVATPDIHPSFLFKSIISEDIEESIKLGMLDITEEEAALCTYVCPSKIAFDTLLRQGLDAYAKEI